MKARQRPAVPTKPAGPLEWTGRWAKHSYRIACAWLIRRFIDPEAHFKFVSAKNYDAESDELRFDMFKAEFTHIGDRSGYSSAH
ncbi:MAG: chromate resistance protein ChrB domain-containing protein [Methyloceanibacter sp.]